MSKYYTEGRRYEQKFNDGRDSVWHTHPVKMKSRPPGEGELKRLVGRTAWDPEPPGRGDMTNLSLPVAHVQYLQTFTKPCTSLAQCKPILQELKVTHMKTGISDIKYNFLISGDGSVYEGRGWTYNPDRSEDRNPRSITFKTIDVACIGTFKDGKLPKKMRDASEDFADWSVHHYKISCCHETRPLKPVNVAGEEDKEEDEDANEDDFKDRDDEDYSEDDDDTKLTKKQKKKMLKTADEDGNEDDFMDRDDDDYSEDLDDMKLTKKQRKKMFKR